MKTFLKPGLLRSVAAAGVLFASTTQAAGSYYGPRNTVPDSRTAAALSAIPLCGPTLRLSDFGPRPRHELVAKYPPCAAPDQMVLAPGFGPRNHLRAFN